MREERAGRVDVEEGQQPGQLLDGGFFGRLKNEFFHHRG